MAKLIIVANRLPVSLHKDGDEIGITHSVGGLATGLSSLTIPYEWVGWPGLPADDLRDEERRKMTDQLRGDHCHPLFLSQNDLETYYYGFSNQTIWPLFHYFPLYTVFRKEYWEPYVQINRQFAEAVLRIAEPNDTIWIHDYQLMLLPRFLRERLPGAAIGFFLHIPFPTYELFRLLPWRREILEGLLPADLVGFHTYDYVHHFIRSATRLLGVEHTLLELHGNYHRTRADAFPMGIDYQKFATAMDQPKVQEQFRELQEQVKGQKVILAIDRLDYTKGILQRLEAYHDFLTRYPAYREKVVLVLVTVPSRTGVGYYRSLKEQIDQQVGRINGAWSTLGWNPIWYLYTSLPFERMVALYYRADAALIAPLRDGMNLIAKEYVACKREAPGVLILSEMAGAASELGEALIINAYDHEALVAAIKTALDMPPEDRWRRNRSMQQRLERYDVFRWANDFLDVLHSSHEAQQRYTCHRLTGAPRENLIHDYRCSSSRVLFLDYDGTLTGFTDRPLDAQPDAELLELLEVLSSTAGNDVFILSGRDRDTLQRWLGHLPLHLVAEHGAWQKWRTEQVWTSPESLPDTWKERILPIIRLYCDRTPRTYIEEKDHSLVWHYRTADPELGRIRLQELKYALLPLVENLQLGVFEGHKILEVKNINANKGRSAAAWLSQHTHDFILALGDDYTDEDMFAALPNTAWTIKVGYKATKARFSVDHVAEARRLLRALSGEAPAASAEV